MIWMLSLIAVPYALWAAGSTPAGCLEIKKPDTVIRGGTYSCVVIAREASGTTLESLMVERSPGHGIEIYADDVTVKNVTVTGAADVGLFVGCVWRNGTCAFIPRGLVIEGGAFMASGYNGIKWDICENCTIRKARISHNGNSGIQINDVGAGPFIIEDSEIDQNGPTILRGHRGRAHGIYTDQPGRFHRNRVHDNGGYGIHVWPGPSLRTSRDKPLDIQFNRIYHNGDGGAVIGGETQGTVVYWHNTEYENGGSDSVP